MKRLTKNEARRISVKTPKHDWASHGAEAFRYLSLSWKEPTPDDRSMTIKDIIAEMINPRSIAQMLEETELAELRTGQDET